MTTHPSTRNHTARRGPLFTAAIVLAGTLAVGLPRPAFADGITPPTVPGDIVVEAGNKPFLQGHATGTQNYTCQVSGSGFAWTFSGPQAAVSDSNGGIINHFLSPNPDEGGTPRPTWQRAQDQSTVWGRATGTSEDPAFVAAGAIPWLRLQAVGAEYGPDGGDKLVQTTFIQRVNTSGGRAPSTGCSASTDVGTTQAVPYTADYIFYKRAD